MTDRRARTAILALVIGLLALLVACPAIAEPLAGAEADFAARIQTERASAGLGGYSTAADLVADLVAVARAHAEDMANQNRLHHNPRLPDQVEGWDSLGENVGRGASVDDIHRAFMESPSHRAEILSTSFTQVGIGVVERDGVLWVVQIFRTPSGPAPAAASTRSPTTTVGSMATPPAIVKITTPAPVGEPLPATAAEAEISGAPLASASPGGGGARLKGYSRSTALAPREVTVPIMFATALLALMTAALVARVAADARTAEGGRPAYFASP